MLGHHCLNGHCISPKFANNSKKMALVGINKAHIPNISIKEKKRNFFNDMAL
jgi:hypothetical protein